MRWLAHILGVDTQQSWPYDFWSGFATQGSVILAACGMYRRHNCHARWCWRIGHHPVAGTHFVTCRLHHPNHDGSRPYTAEQIAEHREGRAHDR